GGLRDRGVSRRVASRNAPPGEGTRLRGRRAATRSHRGTQGPTGRRTADQEEKMGQQGDAEAELNRESLRWLRLLLLAEQHDFEIEAMPAGQFDVRWCRGINATVSCPAIRGVFDGDCIIYKSLKHAEMFGWL